MATPADFDCRAAWEEYLYTGEGARYGERPRPAAGNAPLGEIIYDTMSHRGCVIVAGAQPEGLVTVRFIDGEVTTIARRDTWPL